VGVSSVVVYGYASCPFTNKVLQYLSAARLPHVVVEVEPLFKRELAWDAGYGKVPVAIVNGTPVRDSTVIVDYIEELLRRRDALDGAACGGPAARVALRGVHPLGTGSPEEAAWRRWVDAKLVHTLAPNLYRTLPDAWQAFDYLTQRNFSAAVRLPAQAVGAVAMWGLSGRLKKRHGITDERAALAGALGEWVAAVGDRPFLGGDRPNLADVAVYGVLQGVRTTPTEAFMLASTPVEPWLRRMQVYVGRGSLVHRVGEAPPPREEE
jgi:microsomal prostaglandin-E synthase 2